MPKQIKPGAEFLQLTEADIESALKDPDPANPIAVEVTRLITGYTENFVEMCQRMGRVPSSIVRRKPDSAIEEVAMRLTTETIRATIAGAP